jgi:hypothetical protein
MTETIKIIRNVFDRYEVHYDSSMLNKKEFKTKGECIGFVIDYLK